MCLSASFLFQQVALSYLSIRLNVHVFVCLLPVQHVGLSSPDHQVTLHVFPYILTVPTRVTLSSILTNPSLPVHMFVCLLPVKHVILSNSNHQVTRRNVLKMRRSRDLNHVKVVTYFFNFFFIIISDSKIICQACTSVLLKPS